MAQHQCVATFEAAARSAEGADLAAARLQANTRLLLDCIVAVALAGFLWLAAAFQLFDGLQATANGALRGLKDTRVPMLITLVSYWVVGMPVAWWLGFHTALGAAGLWWGLTAGLGMAALGLSLRFRHKAGKRVLREAAGLQT